jgi:hypothetical protein
MKRIYKPKRTSQLAKQVIVDPRLEEIGSEQKQRCWQRVSLLRIDRVSVAIHMNTQYRPGGTADSEK